jgi:hypothetical protein
MKFSFFLLAFLFVNSSFAQVKRLDVVEIGFVEILFRDSAEVYVMMWDDFTFEYNENYSEIIIREGGSNKRYTYKAKNIEFVQFKNTSETVCDLNDNQGDYQCFKTDESRSLSDDFQE